MFFDNEKIVICILYLKLIGAEEWGSQAPTSADQEANFCMIFVPVLYRFYTSFVPVLCQFCTNFVPVLCQF